MIHPISYAKVQLGRRVPGLARRRRRARWLAKNRDRRLGRGELADVALNDTANRLSKQGIVVTSFADLIGDSELYEEAHRRAWALADAEPADAKLREGVKAFRDRFLEPTLDADDVFVRIALHPNVLAVVNRYLGMRSLLRAVDVWRTVPTPGPATDTQLWHRDGDDFMNAKLFVYFNDVVEPAGPFVYAPRTHPNGDIRELPERDDAGRSNDEQFARLVPETDWVVCTGPGGTAILADTCGYHKQLKPVDGNRLLLIVQYTSGTPWVGQAVTIRGARSEALNQDQRYAISDGV